MRQAILQMLNDISGAYKEGDSEVANLTDSRVVKDGTSAFGMIVKGKGRREPVLKPPESILPPINVYVTLDGKEIGTVVTKAGQKQTRRSVHTRAGRFGGV